MLRRKLLGLITLSEKDLQADIFLAAQIHGAMIKFQIDVEPYPTLAKCYVSYKELSVFEDAVPSKQPDAPAPTI
ncbi:unnamed protein product [Microthlaspi erraticum]|uniref:Uncharacterized protein n=1 Tax=Microthlaspi erraticum TaxID=1685480 RepID=A0A6D2K6C7_9BRAS|nr:unnamed protein product [Microthlaspi erraticum]